MNYAISHIDESDLYSFSPAENNNKEIKSNISLDPRWVGFWDKNCFVFWIFSIEMGVLRQKWLPLEYILKRRDEVKSK